MNAWKTFAIGMRSRAALLIVAGVIGFGHPSWGSAPVGMGVTGQSEVAARPPEKVEPMPVAEVRPGMKGHGWTVMTGTKLERFEAEVLGVLRDVSPGRDMILCRLSGLNLEHSGVIQGMSGSPIYLEGNRLIGAVAFAWEFSKEPIAGVTPYEQMVKFAESAERRYLARLRSKERPPGGAAGATDLAQSDERRSMSTGLMSGFAPAPRISSALPGRAAGWSDPTDAIDHPATEFGIAAPVASASGGLVGLKPLGMPMAATGFSPRAVATLSRDLGSFGMAPMASGAVPDYIRHEQDHATLEPGSPICVAMIRGDFDLSAIGTVTHVENGRVFGFGHPMFGNGACEFPMMTGYVHTVFPRANLSMKMGSPLKVVGTLDADVSTCVSGRLGPGPKLIPMTVDVRIGEFSDPMRFEVEVVRSPKMLSALVLSVLTSAIDHEGSLPEEFTADLEATISLKGREPYRIRDRLSGPRFTGTLGASALFSAVNGMVGLLARNPFEEVEFESIACAVTITPGRRLATIQRVRWESSVVVPGQTAVARILLKPYKGELFEVIGRLDIPEDLPEGTYDVEIADLTQSLRRFFRHNPRLAEPRSFDALDEALRVQALPTHSEIRLHLALPDRSVSLDGQTHPRLPAGVCATLAANAPHRTLAQREDLVSTVETSWMIEGSKTLPLKVSHHSDLSLLEE
ncbi:hypothetical protein Isop_2527 [Isosphaera pallida ATCC 43644]|uniref:Peptidase S55 domain-containing protein n=1 Tax=Isosphaera pallida (strain ATCC 43644 / DSM 9630 / IS1B) TaxID=575540 RepID=E8QYA4_ISOPI|nr:SpoIVB peptidase S55 domain-containing protein [Isosphaera pallida]ADV63099.1 hypothetical protein Isop_2527 [Isosphaera pallida ATCC 43644]